MKIVDSWAPAYHATHEVKKRFPQKRSFLKYAWVKKHLTFQDVLYHLVYLYFSITVRQVLPYIIKEVNRSEEFYR